MTRSSGFTLVEVLVALVVLVLGVLAAARSVGLSVDTTETVRLKLLADWVAENRLEEHRARRDWLQPGSSEGEQVQDGERMHWREQVSETPNVRFRRLQVLVSRAGVAGETLATLDGMLMREAP